MLTIANVLTHYTRWIVAEMLLIPKLQEDTLDVLERRMLIHNRPQDCLNYVYENTVKGSPLRTVFVAIYAERLSSWDQDPKVKVELLLPNSEMMPKEFLIDMLITLSSTCIVCGERSFGTLN